MTGTPHQKTATSAISVIVVEIITLLALFALQQTFSR